MGQIQTPPAIAGAGAPQATVLRRTGTFAMGLATTIDWQAADLDQGGLFDLAGAPKLLTIPAALDGALMVLSATLSGSGITAAARWGGRIIRVTGGIILAEAAMAATAANQISLLSPPIIVVAGETFLCTGTSSDAAWTLDNIATTNFSALYWAP